MTEKEIIKKVAKETGYDIEVVEPIFTSTFKVISDSIMKERIVQIRHFGNFHLKHLDRRVINMHYMSGREAVAPEHLKVTFIAYEDLKRRARRKMIRQQKKRAEQEKQMIEEQE